jgi:hypothetical protein
MLTQSKERALGRDARASRIAVGTGAELPHGGVREPVGCPRRGWSEAHLGKGVRWPSPCLGITQLRDSDGGFAAAAGVARRGFGNHEDAAEVQKGGGALRSHRRTPKSTRHYRAIFAAPKDSPSGRLGTFSDDFDASSGLHRGGGGSQPVSSALRPFEESDACDTVGRRAGEDQTGQPAARPQIKKPAWVGDRRALAPFRFEHGIAHQGEAPGVCDLSADRLLADEASRARFRQDVMEPPLDKGVGRGCPSHE